MSTRVTGGGRLLPVVLLGLLAGGRGAAAGPPPAESFYGGSDQSREATTPFEAPAKLAAARFRDGSAGEDSPDAVPFALFLYAKTGTASDRERAVRAARAIAARGGAGSVAGLYLAARAGAPTLVEAEQLFAAHRLDRGQNGTASTADYAATVLERFARAAARRDRAGAVEASLAAETFLERRTDGDGDSLTVLGSGGAPPDLADLTGVLRVALDDLAWSGEEGAKSVVRGVGGALSPRLDRAAAAAAGGADPETLRQIAEGALALWEAGWVTGAKAFQETAESALRAVVPAVTGAPEKAGSALPAFGLAAARFAEHPVQMALMGDPADSTVSTLREAVWFDFEPRKILLSLDPSTDAAYIETLGYPPDEAPALFVCVGTLCSPPLTTADQLDKKVSDILALAAGGGN